MIWLAPTEPSAAWAAPLLLSAPASVGWWLYVRGRARLRTAAGNAALARALLATGVLYAASGLLPATNAPKLVLLAVSALLLFRELDGSRAGAALLAAAAIAGPLAEAALIRRGLFHYRDPDFLGVPMWLPGLYACLMPALGQLARRAIPLRPARARGAPAP